MKTYQDLQKCGENENLRIDFIYAAIRDHEQSTAFIIGHKAGQFYRHLDPNIEAYQNVVYDIQGKPHVDEISPNHKIMCNFFQKLIDQAIQYLLGNGINFDNPQIKEQLSTQIDHKVKKIAKYAAVDGRGYGLVDTKEDGKKELHPMCFACQLDGNEPYFVPLYDERSGKLAAGIKYWRLADTKPLMATLYEPDGYTEYQEYPQGEEEEPRLTVTSEKTPYIVNRLSNAAQGVYGAQGENYKALPIIEMHYINNQSALVGNEGTITAYNMALSGFANQVDWNLLYWIINNADGMSEQDDINFLADIIKTHVLHTSGDATATPHEITIQHEARGQLLDRLRAQLFEDMGGVDVSKNSANMTATEIKSAYAALNSKCDDIESYIDEFLTQMLDLLGFENETWHYQRDVTINTSEETNNAIASAPYFGRKWTTKRLASAAGMIDELPAIEEDLVAEQAEQAGFAANDDSESVADSIAERIISALKEFFSGIFGKRSDNDADTEE